MHWLTARSKRAWHKLTVRVKDRTARVHARAGYYARPPHGASTRVDVGRFTRQDRAYVDCHRASVFGQQRSEISRP